MLHAIPLADPTRRASVGQDRGGPLPLVLTNYQKPPRQYSSQPLGLLRVWEGGSLIELVGIKGAAHPEPHDGARPLERPYRAPISRFTARSRTGLLKSQAKLDRRGLGLPLFLTLTYPKDYPDDGRRWKRDHEAFCKRLKRKYPQVAINWRLEAQKRGAPHFHNLVYNVPFIPKAWVARQWYEVVGSGDRRHLKFGSRIEKIRSWAGVNSYVAKYMAKPDDGDATSGFAAGVRPGRFWGWFGRANVPRTPVEIDADGIDFHKVRRVIYGLRRARERSLPIDLKRERRKRRRRRYHATRWDGGWTFGGDLVQSQLVGYLGGLAPPRAG